jgi:hypothetical protein
MVTKALPGGMLQVLQHALVAGVVGDDEQEVGMRLDDLALLVDGQDAAVVGQRWMRTIVSFRASTISSR